ncbi:hypothetical protein ACHAXS_005338 [Conticribra weissflogii]
MANPTHSKTTTAKAKQSSSAEWEEANSKNFLVSRSEIMTSQLPFSPQSRHEPHRPPSQLMTSSHPSTRVNDGGTPAVPVAIPPSSRASFDSATAPFESSQVARRLITPKNSPPKPSIGKRVRSVGFADDLKICSSTSDLGGDIKSNLNSRNDAEDLPRAGILKQSINNPTRHVSNPSDYHVPPGSTDTHYTLDQVISSQFENEATTQILAALEEGTIDDSMDRLNSISKGWYEQDTGKSEEKNESDGDELSDTKIKSKNAVEDLFTGASSSNESSDGRHTSGQSPSSSSFQFEASRDSFLQRVLMSHDHAHDPSDLQSSGVSYPVWQRPKTNRTKSVSGVSSKGTTVGEGSRHRDGSNCEVKAIQHNILHGIEGEVIDKGTAHHDRKETQATIDTNNTANLADRLRSLQKGTAFVNRPSFQTDSDREVVIGALGARPESSGDKLINALAGVKPSNQKYWWRRVKSEYNQLIVPRYPKLRKSISRTLFLIVLPCLTVAIILFYRFENPMAGETKTSLSWWIIFLGVRQMVMLELTNIGQIFWIEIMALRSSLFQIIVGPYISLIFIMSKGWPYVIFFWAIFDFCFLYGDRRFAKHWLFWQSEFDIFNSKNPVDGVTDSTAYLRILCIMILVGVAVSLKRLTISLFLGRRTVDHFGGELEKLMNKMILIGEVANLAMDIQSNGANVSPSHSPVHGDDEDEKIVRFNEFVQNDESSNSDSSKFSRESSEEVMPASTKRPITGNCLRISNQSSRLSVSANSDAPDKFGRKQTAATSANAKLHLLLSEWEEPEIAITKRVRNLDSSILCFIASLTHSPIVLYTSQKPLFKIYFNFVGLCPTWMINTPFPTPLGREYSNHSFRLTIFEEISPTSVLLQYLISARTREMCVESSQQVYRRLMESAEDGATALPFSVFSALATDDSGKLVNDKMRSLIRLFRPDRQGNLTKLDFVKSIDTVYKELRLLRASIANSAQIDIAFERIINFFYYFFVGIIAILIWGINVFPFLLSSTTYFLGLALLFGAAAGNGLRPPTETLYMLIGIEVGSTCAP